MEDMIIGKMEEVRQAEEVGQAGEGEANSVQPQLKRSRKLSPATHTPTTE